MPRTTLRATAPQAIASEHYETQSILLGRRPDLLSGHKWEYRPHSTRVGLVADTEFGEQAAPQSDELAGVATSRTRHLDL